MRIPTIVILLILSPGLFPDLQAQAEAPTEIFIPREDYQLQGLLFVAQQAGPAPVVVLLQGIPGAPGDVLGLGQNLSRSGIHVLTFNYSGTHNSGGRWTLKNDQADVQAALDYLVSSETVGRVDMDPDRLYLGGYSHGGGVALIFAANHPEIANVFSIAGNEFGEWARRTQQDAAFAEAVAGAFDYYAEQAWVRPAEGADRELPDNVDRYDVRAKAELLATRNLFLAAGLDDQTTPVEGHMLPVYRALKFSGAQNVRFMTYQTNHSFADSQQQLAEGLTEWIFSAK